MGKVSHRLVNYKNTGMMMVGDGRHKIMCFKEKKTQGRGELWWGFARKKSGNGNGRG